MLAWISCRSWVYQGNNALLISGCIPKLVLILRLQILIFVTKNKKQHCQPNAPQAQTRGRYGELYSFWQDRGYIRYNTKVEVYGHGLGLRFNSMWERIICQDHAVSLVCWWCSVVLSSLQCSISDNKCSSCQICIPHYPKFWRELPQQSPSKSTKRDRPSAANEIHPKTINDTLPRHVARNIGHT